MTAAIASDVERFATAQAEHELRLADYLAHQIHDALGDADLADLIAMAEALGISPKLPPDWRTKREREVAALEEDAAALEKEAADRSARASEDAMTSLITPDTTIAELAEVLRARGARLVCEPEDGLCFAAGIGLCRGRVHRYREASEMCLAAAISAALAKAGAR